LVGSRSRSATRGSSWLTAATGGSCLKAIEVLLEHGVKEEKILFLNLVSCKHLSALSMAFVAFANCKIASPLGIKAVTAKFPKMKTVSLGMHAVARPIADGLMWRLNQMIAMDNC
jgi:hypothetical protein